MDIPATEAEKTPEQPPEQAKDILQTIKKLIGSKQLNNKKLLMIGGALLFLLIFIPVFVLIAASGKTKSSVRTPTPTPAEQQVTKKQSPSPTQKPKQASQVLVYGAWTSQSSVIKAVNLTTSQTTTIATLPLSIKKITVLSPDTLLYIDQTDTNDHGQRISIYNTQEKQIVTSIPVADGFGIDDYILSPNKKYLAIWEVQFAQNAQTLQGGKSRVYAVNLDQPSVVNLLYDETVTQTIPVHVPSAIFNDGTVFTDQFIPNDTKGATGWAYGMSTVDFDGTNKQDIDSMQNGTYGSQPTPSADGKFLLFAGYDGKNGDGKKVVNGYRQAILTPNTVELLDTKTLKRYSLPNLPDTNTYSDVTWDIQTGNIIFTVLSPDATKTGVFSYDPEKLTIQQIPLPTVSGSAYGYISQLTADKTLIGTQSTDASNLGNLGETYAYAYTQVAVEDKNGLLSYLSVEDPFIQYITILPGNYFTPVLGDETSASGSSQPAISYAVLQGNNTPQDTSFLKSTLASRRLQGISSDACIALGSARCAALGMQKNSSAYSICQKIEETNNQTTDACY